MAETKTPKSEKVKITIPRNGSRDEVYVCINGKNMIIKRGTEVEVSKGIAEIIQRSINQTNAAEDYIMAVAESS